MRLRNRAITVALAAITALSSFGPNATAAAEMHETVVSTEAVRTAAEAATAEMTEETEENTEASGSAERSVMAEEAGEKEVIGAAGEPESGARSETVEAAAETESDRETEKESEGITGQSAAAETDGEEEQAEAAETDGEEEQAEAAETAATSEMAAAIEPAAIEPVAIEEADTEAADTEEAEALEAAQEAGTSAAAAETLKAASKDARKAEMRPEFSALEKCGGYVIRISAKAGVFPAGTKVRIREMSRKEAKPYADRAEKMVESGVAEAVIDITFLTKDGNEVQPDGVVDVTFKDVVEEDISMSVFHAEGGDAGKMEEIPVVEKGRDIAIRCDSFSPYVLLAATKEPDWLKGGTGTRKKLSLSIKLGEHYTLQYSSYGLGTWNTVVYPLTVDGQKINMSVCGDPKKDGSKSDNAVPNVLYEYDTPMLVKALYYGVGPGKNTLREIIGTDSVAVCNIVTHVTAAQIYAKMAAESGGKLGTTKSSVDDGFSGTNAKLKEYVNRFVSKLETLDLPSKYYAYAAVINDSDKQDFLFCTTGLGEREVNLKKTTYQSGDAMLSRIKASSLYSLGGAQYSIYALKSGSGKPDREALEKLTPVRTVTTGDDGLTDTFTFKYDKDYYAIETKPPKGFIRSNMVYKLSEGTVEVEDHFQDVYLQIEKKGSGAGEGQSYPPLAGAEFKVYRHKPENGVFDEKYLVGTLVTGNDGKTQKLTLDQDGNPLLLQNYYVMETKAPAGYEKVDNFRIDATEPQEAVRHTLIMKTVYEPVDAVKIVIAKESQNGAVTDGSSKYSLEGAVFEIYNNEACSGQPVATVKTDKDGTATAKDLVKGSYWAKETQAPPYFLPITSPIQATASPSDPNTLTCTVSETPKTAPLALTLVKKATGAGENDIVNSLAGAEFEVNFYKDEFYKSENELKGKTPDKSWKLTTRKVGERYVADFSDPAYLSGSDFYTDASAAKVLPAGTVTITETKAPAGYLNDPDFGGGSGIYIGNVMLDSAGNMKLQDLVGRQETGNTIIISETSEPPLIISTAAKDVISDSQLALASQNVKLADKVNYDNLVVGKKYELKALLMDKETGEVLKDRQGNDVTSTVEFTAGSMKGSVDVGFEFEADEYFAGKTVVAFEYLYDDGDLVAQHAEIDDVAQTIHFPDIGTTAVNPEASDADPDKGEIHVVRVGEDAQIRDTVRISNILADSTYTLLATVVSKATGEEVSAAGEPVRSVKTFTSESADMTEEILLTLNTEEYAGEELVVYEKLYLGPDVESGSLVAVHENPDDAGQTIGVTDLKTNASSGGVKVVLAAADRIIDDDVAFVRFAAGREYKISGEIKLQKEGLDWDSADAAEAEITAVDAGEYGEAQIRDGAVYFTPSGEEGEFVDGTIRISFKVDGSKYVNEKLVVGESVTINEVPIAVHKDLWDDAQTVYIPTGGTSAIDASTCAQIAPVSKEATTIDHLCWYNLIPGETYQAVPRAMLKSSETEIESAVTGASFAEGTEGTEISFTEETVTFVPLTEDGALDILVTYDSSVLGGDAVVMYETVQCGGVDVIVHCDINDTAQTVYFPNGHTKACDPKTGENTMTAGGSNIVRDRFIYENLLAGATYELEPEVALKPAGSEAVKMIKATLVDAKGNAIEKFSFTPQEADGYVDVYLKIDSDDLAGRDIVMFETLFYINSQMQIRAEVAEHKDISDEAQTIHFPSPDVPTVANPEPSPSEPSPDTPSRTYKTAKTGDAQEPLLWLGLILVSGIISSGLLIHQRRRR